MVADRRPRGAAAIALALIAGAATAQPSQVQGYIAPDALDIVAVLPAAPQPHDARAEADRAIFRRTRRWFGTPRWDLAVNDVDLAPAALMRDFSCAAGVTLTPDAAPRTAALLARASDDASRQSAAAKTYFRRLRPFQIDHGRICQPAEQLRGSFDYPSGHTTLGWTWATLLAMLIPDRATAILARGRAFGESRIVCGVHNASAVEAGRLTASTTVAAMVSQPAFRDDLVAAADEMTALRRRATPLAGPQCDAEARLITEPVLSGPSKPHARHGR